MKISYSFGLIDLLHFGHIKALKKAKQENDLSVFGLVSDDAAEAWMGVHVSDESERRTVVESIKYVDEVWPQSTFDPVENLRILHKKYPNAEITLYHGNEWAILSAKKYVQNIGGRVVKIDYYDKLSPQAILDTLNTNVIQKKQLNSNLISTKANTLQSLKEMIRKARIEEMYIVTIGEFSTDNDKVADDIVRAFKAGKIVVRSSSKREDAFEESNAGHFESILDVSVIDREAVKHAIATVISSYGEEVDDDEQVLIQRQTEDVLVSGVVFTRDIQRNRPYYVINYDDSGSTDSVTSGSGGYSAWLSYDVDKNNVPLKWRSLMEAVWEMEEILKGILLDIEFAITSESVVIFQVRPLAAAYKYGRKNNKQDLQDIKEENVKKYLKRCGMGLTCYSDMAFWNPAEIIGDNPKNLDYSLYREIITKSAWNEGLVPMGYRPVPKELMYRFGNKPYISVERSFEALMPSALSDDLSKKLRDYYINELKDNLSAHDKIEFEISHNCYDFSMHVRLAKLMTEGFSTEEILELENALKQLTIKTISSYADVLATDMESLKQLEGIRLDINNITSGTTDFRLIAKSIHTLLDSINKFGTPQFSRHARCAFIAKSMCKSLVTEGYITFEQYNQFMSSIRTIAVDYDRDYHAVLDGRLDKDQFMQIYGHLRAGTYNIRNPRYDQMSHLFSKKTDRHKSDTKISNLNEKDVIDAFDNAIINSGLVGIKGVNVVDFVKKATEQREYFKFIFTKSLSQVIELIKQIGTIASIHVADLSYLELPEIYATEFYSDVDRLNEFWSLIIDKRHDLFKINSEMILPAVICSRQDFVYIENINSRPNFITERKVTAEVVLLEDDAEESVDGKIVVIEKADPGYDWIFSKGIVGLITKYGGAASHMAIRCAEFKIPAAIGSGAILYEYAIASHKLTIDCKHEKIIREV
ncbi:PEP-utilizing enzyme [Selenomonas caprae]|nr:PEP-utilizing enzyme [Selenomonas caprae]